MKSFIGLEKFAISNGLANLLVRVAKGEGREITLANTEPALLDELHHSSVVTSAVASCAIENIHVSENRLEELIFEKEPLTKRDEQEVLNYKKTLDFLYSQSSDELLITPELIRNLHGIALEGSPHAGEYKEKDNQIVETVRGISRVRFRPISARETRSAIEALCVSYQHVLDKELVAPQIAAAALTFDFTCIHPFTDGNGRVSRLLSIVTMLSQGRQMPRLISLEGMINERKEAYYLALEQSSFGWHSAQHDLTPFVCNYLQILAAAYDELQQKILRIKEPVVVLFDNKVPPKLRETAFHLFSATYPNASWRATILPALKKVTIEGYSSTLDAENFPKLNHALKLAEKCFMEATVKVQRSRG